MNISTSANAQSALSNIDSAISSVATARAEYGSIQNRFEAAISNLQITSESFTAAESRIRDADIAFETSQFTKNQVLVQSGIAVLAQANRFRNRHSRCCGRRTDSSAGAITQPPFRRLGFRWKMKCSVSREASMVQTFDRLKAPMSPSVSLGAM